nr:MAG TPA: hypothetical protein [Caudoviricetes sp.]
MFHVKQFFCSKPVWGDFALMVRPLIKSTC